MKNLYAFMDVIRGKCPNLKINKLDMSYKAAETLKEMIEIYMVDEYKRYVDKNDLPVYQNEENFLET